MSNILLAGDSWGIGVFAGVGENYGPTGQGIQSILETQGYSVINISKAGISNENIINNISENLQMVDHVIFLQTDIFRNNSYHGVKGIEPSWRWLREEFISELLNFSSLHDYIDNYFELLYTKLDSIAKLRNQKILCIGGWSDIHPYINKFDNLEVLIPSATQLLIPEVKEQVYISDGEYFIQLNDNVKFMNKFDYEIKKISVNSLYKSEKSCKKWNDVHPDIYGYTRIVDSILLYLAKKY